MMRKTQLKRLSLQNISQQANSTTNGEMIAMVKQVITQRNDSLRQKASQLKAEIQKVRKQTKKVIKQMNQAVRDRVNKKEKIVMDKNSRPTHEDIKDLAELYNYMEHQTGLIDINNKSIDRVMEQRNQYLTELQGSFQNPQQKFTELDNEYHRLLQQSQKQQVKLQIKTTELQDFKTRVDNIHKSIEEYRLKYENIESIIRQRQRELDRLVTYFKTRKQQDQDNINRERRLANVIESELIQKQAMLNANISTNEQLRILQIQGKLNCDV